jgi:hypothetical protein
LFLTGVASGFEEGPGFGAVSADPDGALALSGFGAAEPPDDPESLDGLEAALGFGPGPLPPPEPPFGPPATPVSGFSRATGRTIPTVPSGAGGTVGALRPSTRPIASRGVAPATHRVIQRSIARVHRRPMRRCLGS